jgi:hypothetical protein
MGMNINLIIILVILGNSLRSYSTPRFGTSSSYPNRYGIGHNCHFYLTVSFDLFIWVLIKDSLSNKHITIFHLTKVFHSELPTSFREEVGVIS